MVEIVNLRQARKAKKRATEAAEAQANRARHGASLVERRMAHDEAERLARTLDGARRDEARGKD